MAYLIIGRVIDESFDGISEDIVGYFVVGDDGQRHFGSVQKIYKLYKSGKISGIKKFDKETGVINLNNIDNSLLPTYASSLFNGSAVPVYSIDVGVSGVYIVTDANGNSEYYQEKDIIDAVQSGQIRLNNAVVSGKKINVNKAISILGVCYEGGKQIGYKVALPNGEIKTLSKTEVVEDLIKKQGLKLFNAKIDSNGNMQAKDGTLPKINKSGKQESDIKENKRIKLKLKKPILDGYGLLIGYRVQMPNGKINKYSCEDICKLAAKPEIEFEDEYISKVCKISNGELVLNDELQRLFLFDSVQSVGDKIRKAYISSKYIIIPAVKMADDLDKFIIHCCNPVECLGKCYENIEVCIVPNETNLYYREIVAIYNLRYMNSEGNTNTWFDFIFDKELIKAYTREAGGLLYLDNGDLALAGCTNDCRELEVKDGTEVILTTGIEDSNIEHLILPDSFWEFCGDLSKCKKLKKITYKGNNDEVIEDLIHLTKDSKIKLYVQK